MNEDDLLATQVDSIDNGIISPSGRNLGLVCRKNTTLFTDLSVKDVHISQKYVSLEITKQTTGYTLQKLYGHPNLASNFSASLSPQPAVVVPTYRGILTLFDSDKGESGSRKLYINLTRDAWYYLGVKDGLTMCRNIAFEPEANGTVTYLTEQGHFPSRASKSIHGFYLLENESQRGQDSRLLHAMPVPLKNVLGHAIPTRKSPDIASNVMFHIGGFYDASARYLHHKWLGGSEGCFAFIPEKSKRATPEEAAAITYETTFVSNGTWINLTTIIENYRDLDSQKRFMVKLEKRESMADDSAKTVIFIAKKSII
jgi:hypothetical protein